MRSLLNNRCIPSHARPFSFSSSSSSFIVVHYSLYLRSSSFSSSSTSPLLRRLFCTPPSGSKPTFYDNVHQNFNIAHQINKDDNANNPLVTPVDAIERDEFLPPPTSSATSWNGAINPDGDESDCTGKFHAERSKFLLVKHSTLFKMQHAIWLLILAFFINSFFAERRMAQAEEKPGVESAPSPGLVTSVRKKLWSYFGYYWSQLNDKLGLGGNSILLPPQQPDPFGRPVRTVVVNFEKTLVHSEWTRDTGWILTKRPYVTYFLERLARSGYEVVLFTDMNQFDCEQSVADLDQTGVIRHRLYRDSMNVKEFHFVKDLNRLGRDLKNVVMIDHSSGKTGILTPDNCIPVSPWMGDLSDKELFGLAVLLDKCQKYNVPDMREVVKQYRANPRGNPFAEEEKRAEEQERLLREEEGGPRKPRKNVETDSSNKSSSGGIGAVLSGLFARK